MERILGPSAGLYIQSLLPTSCMQFYPNSALGLWEGPEDAGGEGWGRELHSRRRAILLAGYSPCRLATLRPPMLPTCNSSSLALEVSLRRWFPCRVDSGRITPWDHRRRVFRAHQGKNFSSRPTPESHCLQSKDFALNWP